MPLSRPQFVTSSLLCVAVLTLASLYWSGAYTPPLVVMETVRNWTANAACRPDTTHQPGGVEELYAQAQLLSFAVARPSSATHPHSDRPLLVPSLVHLVRLGGADFAFTFPHYVALRSIDRFLAPQLLVVWGDALPGGQWWERAQREVANIYFMKVSRVATIAGQVVSHPEHEADLLRLQILARHGGIYFDADVIVVRSFDDVRVYDFAACMAKPGEALSNGVLVAAPNAKFTQLWLEAYGTYRNDSWAGNSVVNGMKLARLYPHLVHVETTRFVHPLWTTAGNFQMYGRVPYNYTDNYSVHIFNHFKWFFIPKNEEQLAGYNCTLGRVMRYVLYGTDALRDVRNVTYGIHDLNAFNTTGWGV